MSKRDYLSTLDDSWSYRRVYAVAILCIISFFTWAHFTQIHEHVRAQGRIVPSGKARVIQHLEGGIVHDILVREGEKVKAGDVLYYVRNAQAQAELDELLVALDSYAITLVRLEAERSEKTSVVFSRAFQDKYPDIIGSEYNLFTARYNEFQENVDGLEKRMRQKLYKLDELNSNAHNLSKELSVAQEQLEIKIKLRKKGAVSKSEYLTTVSTVRGFETRIEKIRKEIPIVKTEIGELTNVLEERRQKRFSEVNSEITATKIKMRTLQERKSALTDQINRTAIRSPVEGIVNTSYINTIGGVIPPGGAVAEIIPLNETLIVEGKITTNERGKIWPGLPVVAQISAYDYTLYGGVDGELTYVSANSLIDHDNVEYYQVKVSLNAAHLGDHMPIYPGMTANINIISGKISILHALLKPIWHIRAAALREK